MPRFQNQSILVVGAYSEIGRAVARRMAEEGAQILGVGRDEARLQQARGELPGAGHEILVADAADWSQLQPAIQVGKRLGGFAGAVVAAGLHEVRPLSLLDADTLHRAYDANVTTALLATRLMTKAASRDGAGVVWLSSAAALRGTAAFGAYAAAKGALVSAARVAAVELAARRIRVNVVAAGVVRTAMSEAWLGKLNDAQKQAIEKDHLLGLGRPEDVAGVVAFLLSSDARWMTGSLLTVDGGLCAR